MSKLYSGSICLTDIPKEKITTSEKNGKKYLNINIWVNDEVDNYGNLGSIQVSQTKDEREAKVKKVYIGNFKEPKPIATEQPTQPNLPTVSAPDAVDDLPF